MVSPKSRVKSTRPARERRERLEQRAFELAKDCPVSHTNPSECPLCKLRQLPAAQRKAWLRRLSDDELEYLAVYHRCCSAVKKAQAGK